MCIHIYVYMYIHTKPIQIHIFMITQDIFPSSYTHIPQSWIRHCFFYYFATRQKLADVKNLPSLEEKKLMSSGQIKAPTAGEEAEGLWGCCCQLSVFGKTRGRDHTQRCSKTLTLTNINKTWKRKFHFFCRVRPTLITLITVVFIKTILWGWSFYFPVSCYELVLRFYDQLM